MRAECEIGTDIAMIGLWDPAHPRHDLGPLANGPFMTGLEEAATLGQLFFVSTYSDGSYKVLITVDEAPDPDEIKFLSVSESEFLIESQSGELVAGGVEYFKDANTSGVELDRICVEPESFAIQAYKLDDAATTRLLRHHLGDNDYEYFQRRIDRWPWGCLSFVLVPLSIILRQPSLTLYLLGGWLLFVVIRFVLRLLDTRFQELMERADGILEPAIQLVWVLRKLSPPTDLKGGWDELV